jgi:hypothetical protein
VSHAFASTVELGYDSLLLSGAVVQLMGGLEAVLQTRMLENESRVQNAWLRVQTVNYGYY